MNLQSLLGTIRKYYLTRPSARPAQARTRLRVESLEDRAVPAVLPAPVVDQSSFRSISNDGWGLAMAADPNNPNQIFSAFVTHAANGTRISISYSTNGGTTWSSQGFIQNAGDPKHTDGTLFEHVTDPNIAWDRFGNVFLTYSQYHTDFTAGQVTLRKYSFNGAPALIDSQTMYSWFDSTEAWAPNVNVDSNRPSFQDPEILTADGLMVDPLAQAQTDDDQVRVFVTWSSRPVGPATLGSAVVMRYSDDGGATFQAPLRVSGGYSGTTDLDYVFSDIVFTPGRSGVADSGGRMVTLMTRTGGGQPNTVISDSLSFGSTNGVPHLNSFVGTTGAITDAIDGSNPDIDTPQSTNFTITVPAGVVPRIDNISLDLGISHQNLSHLQVTLTSPGGQTIQLVNNRINSSGGDFGAGSGLAGTSLNTRFADSAPFTINQGAAPYSMYWRPQNGNLESTFNSTNPANFVGTWTLTVTDHRASATGSVNNLRLWLGSGLSNNATVGQDRNTGAGIAVADDRGLSGPAITAIADTSLGAYSPYQNRVYFATGDSVQVRYTDGVDATQGNLWSANASTVDSGNFPQLTIDPSTGTLLVSYYTTKFDAAGARSTMMMSSAINMPEYNNRLGTIEFAPGVWVTPQETTYDQIRSQVIEVEPVPSNGPAASDARMWGNSHGLLAFDSHVVLVYPGNLNSQTAAGANLTQLRTQNIEINGGPRVVATDSGPILGDAFASGNFDSVDYNLEGSDGRNRFEGFTVEFDRIIDPTTFNPDDVKVIYRSPTDNPVGPGTTIGVAAIERLDRFRDPTDSPAFPSIPTDYGSKRFFVRLSTPQTAVGTYSLLIGSSTLNVQTSIKDRVRDQVFTYTPNGDDGVNSYPAFGPPANDQIQDFAGSPTPLNTTINVRGPVNINAATQVGTLVTITTFGPHGFTTGTNVTIAGVSVPGYNGNFAITVTGGNTFTYTRPAGLTPGFGGTATPPNAFQPGTVIFDITVRVNLEHTDVGDLQLDLTAPNGQVIRLVNRFDAFGDDFQDTRFNDAAPLSLADDFGPYPQTYVPAESLLTKLFGDNPAGTWRLTITDLAAGDTGLLHSWSLEIVGASTPSIVVGLGNEMDQDGDGVSNETPVDIDTGAGVILATRDAYALPNPIPFFVDDFDGGVFQAPERVITPFRLPYDPSSMPIVITGPRLLETHVPNEVGTSTDQLVKDAPVTAVNLTFDRVIDAATFSPADILRMRGPLGEISLTDVTVTPTNSAGTPLAAGTDSRFFRIAGFPAQELSGTYTIQLGSQIADTSGNLLDTNYNAGVGNLVGNVSGADVLPTPFGGDPLNGGLGFAVPGKGTTTVELDIATGFLLQKAKANLTVVFPSIPGSTTEYANLEGRLVAPDGTSILLFANSPENGAGNMTNLTFLDDDFFTPTTPPGPPISVASIEDGFVANGFNNPISPLAQLINHGSQGTWKLVIKNKGNVTARVDKFQLILDKPVIPSGLGEEVADRVVASFRIANTDGSTDLSKANWSPVGPAPQIDLNDTNSTAGRVSSLAVDPSDPSGNTVYAAGASGGVWRTTNFLTRDPDGPVWVPLTDFGPNNAINVGFLSVYNSKTDPNTNGDPEKTVILVGTGSQALNVIDEEDDRRFDGVGFLLSEDAGRTWQVLDSTDNYDDVLDKFRPFTDTEAAPTSIANATQAGTTVTIQTATPHGYPIGTVVDIQGVSVAGYNGTGFVITGVPGPNHFTYTTTAGLAAGTGGTSQAFDRRNHSFVGTVINKIVYEKNPDAFSNRPIIWAAIGRGITPASANMAGLWRSTDGARTWVQVRSGEATDFVLAPGSQLPNSNDRATIGYLAIEGEGVYFIGNLDSPTPSFTLMNGGVGRPTVNGGSMTVLAPANTPIGNFGRITLAAPAFVRGDALANLNYQHWLYVAVANDDGSFRGLYMTKDRGDNWTRVKLTGGGGFSDAGNDVDITINPSPAADDFGGNHSLTLAVDPNDPNVVYFGSNALIKIDTTLIADPYNATLYNHSNNEGGIRPNTFDGLQGGTGGGGFNGLVPGTAGFEAGLNNGEIWNHLNLVRDPFSPFSSDTALSVSASNFQNNGRDVRWVLAGGNLGEGSGDFNWVSQIITYIDPLTGMARVAFGTDEGITSFVINQNVKPNQSPVGSPNQMNGFNQQFQVQDVVDNLGNYLYETDIQLNDKRNGNLQVARLYSGDSQPSLLAASVAQSLLYGAARRLGDVQVSPADSADAAILWDNSQGIVGRIGRANYVAADQTGSGNVYILRRIQDIIALGGNPINFFQISKNGGSPDSFTNGLFSTSSGQNIGQWTNQVKTFAVNPIDPNGIVMGSSVGRVYITRNMGLSWDYRGEPNTLDSTKQTAFAFGAPSPGSTNLNDYIYAGTNAGNIWVTKTFGGDINNAGDLTDSWVNIEGGIWGNLDGSPIQKIIPSPTRGSNELFAITRKGVYRMEDWDRRDPLNPSIRTPTQWENITTNLRTITSSAYGLGDDWVTPILGFDNPGQTGDSGEDPFTTIAVDWRPTFSPVLASPVLYVGGDGGVFRAVYNADMTTWSRFTGETDGASSDGGGLPMVKVTDIDLALGNVDPNTGRQIPNGAPDAVVVSTLGRGMWAIGLEVPPGVSGPRVVESTPVGPLTTSGLTSVTVTFDQSVKAGTFTAADAFLTTPTGQIVNAIAVTDITVVVPGVDPRTVWQVDFPTQNDDGTYTITIGPDIASGAAQMDQDGDANNGEAIQDQFKMFVVVGRNDLIDFVKDVYERLLGRQPTVADVLAKNVAAMEKVRLTALGTILRELLGTYNSTPAPEGVGEARQRMIERFANIPGGAIGEIGDFLGFDIPTDERDAFALALKKGLKTPQGIMAELIATTDVSKMWYNQYFVFVNPESATAAEADAWLTKVYADLFNGLGINPITMLPASTLAALRNRARTPAGRSLVVRSLANGSTVKYDADGVGTGSTVLTTTSFRIHFVNLAYAQYLPGYTPTATDLKSARSMMAKPRVANSLQGAEWVIWKIMSSKPYFNLQSQSDGLPDDGLHTTRAWVESVIQDRSYRASTDTEHDVFSQKVLDKFKTQRSTFLKGILYGTEYRGIKINEYFQLVHSRDATTTEVTAWQKSMKLGTSFAGLLASRLATAEFYTDNTSPPPATTAVRNGQWAQAVYQRLLSRPATPAEELALVKKIASVGRKGAAATVIGSTEFREIIINQNFMILLNRLPTANELAGYQQYLKSKRWENIVLDMLASGLAYIPGSPATKIATGLPREFWEEAN